MDSAAERATGGVDAPVAAPDPAAPHPIEARVQPRPHARRCETVQRYDLQAKLDPAARSVEGRAQIHFTNTSALPLSELWLHLYLNAFRDRRSVFMSEAGGTFRAGAWRGPGALTLHSLQVAGRDRLTDGRGEWVRGDFTQLRVRLREPLAPGESLEITTRFTAQLPPAFARTGYAHDFFLVGQWFPKLAKLEPDGLFAPAPYHALAEFYADFADYTLRIWTPAGYRVGATGQQIAARSQDGGVLRTYEAKCVHDAAWAAAPQFQTLVERVDQTQVTYLAPPGYGQALREHARVVRAGLRYYGDKLAPYPYPSLTVIVPPRGAEGAAGMEFPSLLVTAGSWAVSPWLPWLAGPAVTAHELAHQWFYGMVASDERSFPVLDEGLAQWATLDFLRGFYGARDALLPGAAAIDRFELERIGGVLRSPQGPPGLAASAYGAREYAASVYSRAALALESLRRAHGAARFDRALRRYVRRHRFTHARPSDLMRAFDREYGEGFSARTLRPLLLRGDASAVAVTQARTRAHRGRYRTDLRARRRGSVSLPTWVALYDRHGVELRRVAWPASAQALHASVETPRAVARVVADPDRALLLDPDLSDQELGLADVDRPTLSPLWIALIQALLAWWGP